MLGVVGLVALVDLIRDSQGAVELSVLGLSLGERTNGEVALVAGVLGLLVGAAVVGAFALLSARRHRERERERAREESDTHRLETMRRLLQEQVDMLAASVRELEARKDELRAVPAAGPTAGPQSTSDDGLIVLPEAPRADRTPGNSRP